MATARRHSTRISLLTLGLGLLVAGSATAQSSDTAVLWTQKINASEGGFGGVLDATSGFGASLAVIGDLDGNGVPDLAVGGPTHDDSVGSVWVLMLDSDGSVLDEVEIGPGLGGFGGVFGGGNPRFGSGVAGPGDLDGDGVPDLAVMSQVPLSLWLLPLNVDGTVKATHEIPLAGILSGTDPDLASLGDFDGNGVVDYVVSAPNLAGGRVALLFMGPGFTLLDDVLITPRGSGGSGFVYGQSVTVPGDLDGNGYPEVVATRLVPASAEVYFLDAGGAVLDVQGWDNQLPGGVSSIAPGVVTPVGDLNGDGVGDLLARGRRLLFMNADGSVHHAVPIDPGAGGFPSLPDPLDSYGGPPVLLGDIDGDGRLEVAVGSPEDGQAGVPPAFHPGAVWIVSLEDRWFDMGFGLGGATQPSLLGAGTLVGGEPVSLTVSGGPPHAPGTLWFGLNTLDAPFKGGLLVPTIDIGIGLSLDGAGALDIQDTWPLGFPSNVSFTMQMWMADAGGPVGLAATNAVQARTP